MEKTNGEQIESCQLSLKVNGTLIISHQVGKYQNKEKFMDCRRKYEQTSPEYIFFTS